MKTVRGHLQNVGLSGFVQLIAIEKESCAVLVRADGHSGRLGFVGGDLCSAEMGGLVGEEAALAILGWEVADVEMADGDPRQARTVTASLPFLLIEAMRRKDEALRGAEAALERTAGGWRAPVPGALAALAYDIEGFQAAALIELSTGQVIEAESRRSGLDLAAAGEAGAALVRQALSLLGALQSASTLDDVLLTFDDQIHLLRRLRSGLALFLAVDRGTTSTPALRAALKRHLAALGSTLDRHPGRR